MVKNKQNYMNNPNLPAVGAEFEYTPEQIRQLTKAKKNLLYFAENFFYIISLDEGKQKIKLIYHKNAPYVRCAIIDSLFY